MILQSQKIHLTWFAIKSNKSSASIAKIKIKSEKLTLFGGIFSIMEQYNTLLFNIIDSTLGLRGKIDTEIYSALSVAVHALKM